MTDKYGRRGDGEYCQCDASYIHSVGQHRAHDRPRESTDLMDGGVTAARIEEEAEQPRPLTPGDFQAFIQESELAIARRVRALDPTGRFQPSSLRLADAIYRGIRDSQRPEGAEELAAAIAEWDETGVVVRSLDQADTDELADHLAVLGYRKTGAES